MGLEGYVLIAFLLTVLQSIVYRRFGARKIQYTRYFNRRAVYADDTVEMIENIANRKWLPLPWLRLETVMHASLQFGSQLNLDIHSGSTVQNHRSLFSLMPYTRIVRRHTVTCTRRGWFRLNTAALTCGDMFGFYAKTIPFTLQAELLVYPKPVPWESIPWPSHSWQGKIAVRRWIPEDPFTSAGTREYRPGDSLRQIHWKATARTGQLQVQRREVTADHRLMVYVNVEVTEKMWDAVTDPERIERGIAYAASIVKYGIAQGMETGFGCNGYIPDLPKSTVRIAALGGKEHAEAILETMAKLEIARSLPFDAFLEEDVVMGTTQTDMILITSFVSEKMAWQIRQLEQMGNAVTVIPLSPLSPASKEGGADRG